MSTTRIFIGNLNVAVKEKHLTEKFSSYGNIANIELKNKLDFEGNPISKFAYVSLESQPTQIKQCIYSLDGSSLKGSVIKVDVARESFLERLKREREQNSSTKSSNKLEECNDSRKYSFNLNSIENSEEPDRSQDNDHYSYTNVEEPRPDKKQYEDDREYDTQNLEEEEYDTQNLEEEPDYQRNNFDDGGNRRNYENDRYSKRRSQDLKWDRTFTPIVRYDPTVSEKKQDTKKPKKEKKLNEKCEVPKLVKVSSDLRFGNESSGFSLLSMLGRERAEEDDAPRPSQGEKPLEPPMVPVFPLVHDIPPHRKTKRFFIKGSDPHLQAGVDWLTSPLTNERRSEFEAVRPHLISMYKRRKNQAEKVNKSMRGRRTFGKKFNSK